VRARTGIAASSFSDGVRECSVEGGGVLREEITSRDEDARRYEYAITEAPFPIESHHASMSVEPTGSVSTVIWTTEINPDELAEAMAPVFEDGLRALKAHLEAS
jgi:hypothetical protein